MELEVTKGNLDANIGEHRIRIERLEKVRVSQEQLIEKLEAKLREDAQTLMSNKGLIDYLNKSLNEAQKFSFKTLVNQKGNGPAEVPREFGAVTNNRVNALRQSSISPLRASQNSYLPPRHD